MIVVQGGEEEEYKVEYQKTRMKVNLVALAVWDIGDERILESGELWRRRTWSKQKWKRS